MCVHCSCMLLTPWCRLCIRPPNSALQLYTSTSGAHARCRTLAPQPGGAAHSRHPHRWEAGAHREAGAANTQQGVAGAGVPLTRHTRGALGVDGAAAVGVQRLAGVVGRVLEVYRCGVCSVGIRAGGLGGHAPRHEGRKRTWRARLQQFTGSPAINQARVHQQPPALCRAAAPRRPGRRSWARPRPAGRSAASAPRSSTTQSSPLLTMG